MEYTNGELLTSMTLAVYSLCHCFLKNVYFFTKNLLFMWLINKLTLNNNSVNVSIFFNINIKIKKIFIIFSLKFFK